MESVTNVFFGGGRLCATKAILVADDRCVVARVVEINGIEFAVIQLESVRLAMVFRIWAVETASTECRGDFQQLCFTYSCD